MTSLDKTSLRWFLGAGTLRGVLHHISAADERAAGRGVCYTDPAFGIELPGPVTVTVTVERDHPEHWASGGRV
jgi:hypothetical protein